MWGRRAVLAASLVALTAACTGEVPEPEVAGPFGGRPTITFPAGTPPATPWVAEPATGDGAPLEPGGLAVVQFTAHLWDGKLNRLVDSTFNRGAPAAFPLGGKLPRGLDAALRGRRAGSRVVAAVPVGEGSRADLFYVVDILGVHPAEPAVDAGAGEVAGVRVGAGTSPELDVPGGAPPREFAAAVLARGDGPAVQAGRLTVVQYAGATWSDGRIFASTRERGRPDAVIVGDGGVIAGWDRALIGVPVGSRVAMVVPPGDGYGATGHRGLGIGPEETLVYVVDVLAAY